MLQLHSFLSLCNSLLVLAMRTFLVLIYSLLLLLFTATTTNAFAEDAPEDEKGEKGLEWRNQIKLNLLGLPFRNVQFNYDYALHDQHTLGLSLNYMFPWRGIGNNDINNQYVSFANGVFRGSGINIQYKFYPYGSRKGMPGGIYFGGMLRHQRLRYQLDVSVDSQQDVDVDFLLNMQLNSYSIGLEVGYQLALSERFVLDLSFFGPRYAYNVFKAGADVSLSGDMYEEMTDGLNDYFGFDVINFVIDLERPSFRAPFNFVGWRSAIAIGYVF